MSYQTLLQVIKGSTSSGNFGHSGRPGKRGGSAPGGGHSAIGVLGSDLHKLVDDYRNSKRGADLSKYQHYQTADEQAMVDYYSIDELLFKKDSYAEAVDFYVANGYTDVNDQLRNGDVTKQIASTAKNLDTVINKAKRVPHDMKVMRGISNVDFIPAVGSTFQDKGFVSTSIDMSPRGVGWDVTIYVPKGSKGAYLSSYVGDMDKELLLPRNSKFKILSKDEKNKTIHMELLND